MKAKVIIAQATAETVGFLYELVKEWQRKQLSSLIRAWTVKPCSFRWINMTCLL